MAKNGIVGCSRLARLESTFLVRTVNVDWLVLGCNMRLAPDYKQDNKYVSVAFVLKTSSQAPLFRDLASVQKCPWYSFSFASGWVRPLEGYM